ncbi:MAG: hypothetical protein IT270_21505 [Saprospiraceae bacterium]|nr:hypothetical protein [Saprospiraceae bacterium]MCC6414242.1 hypothetical protein [Saprospiraceae bacterium]
MRSHQTCPISLFQGFICTHVLIDPEMVQHSKHNIPNLPSILLALSLILLPHLTQAQESPLVRHFNPDVYGAQNQNWALAQSPQGFLYAGNNSGLLSFDGSRWQLYNLPEKQTLRALAIDPEGRIFCGGFAEFGYWFDSLGTGKLVYTSLSGNVQADLVDKEEIWHIVAMPGYVLFQSFSTVYRYDYKTVMVIKPPAAIMFAQNIDGRVYLPVIGRGLYELLPDNTFRFLKGSETLAGNIVQFITRGPNGALWIGTDRFGIYTFENEQCIAWKNPLNEDFKRFQLNKAVELKQGGWAVGTIRNGVYILDQAGKLRFHLNQPSGLQNNTVLSLQEDQSNNLWIGLDRGIDYAVLKASLSFFNDPPGRIGTVYTAAYWQGALYLGSNQGVFVQQQDGFRAIEGTQGQVWQLAVYDGQLLCGHNNGTFRIQNNKAVSLSDITGGWCFQPVPGREDLLLQSTYTGIVLYRKNTAGMWGTATRVEGFSEPLKEITFDTRGNIWGVHPNRGLFRLKLSADWMRVEEIQLFTKNEGLPGDYQLDLCKLNDSLVLNSAAGPYLMRERSDGKTHFEPLGQSGKPVKWIAGKTGDYFVVDNKNVSLVQKGRVVNHWNLSLVPGYENIVVLSNGDYLFCLENGFANMRPFTPENGKKSDVAALIRWVYLPVSGRVLSTSELETNTLPYRDNSLKLRFATPSFDQAPVYFWKLEGLTDEWSDGQTEPEKEFSNLPPGAYVFRVRNSADGPETTVRFRIAPPWYLSLGAWVVYVLLFLGIIYQIEKINQKRLEKQREKLEAENRRELERQRTEAEREMLALEVDNKSKELSNAALNLIRKNEVLQHLKDTLLESKNDPRAMSRIVREIDAHLESDHDWEIFETSFNAVHDDFFKRLMHDFPDMTPGDLRLAAYLKMNLASKEIAPLLNISVRGVENKRYRLRRKLGLPEEANLTEFMINY